MRIWRDRDSMSCIQILERTAASHRLSLYPPTGIWGDWLSYMIWSFDDLQMTSSNFKDESATQGSKSLGSIGTKFVWQSTFVPHLVNRVSWPGEEQMSTVIQNVLSVLLLFSGHLRDVHWRKLTWCFLAHWAWYTQSYTFNQAYLADGVMSIIKMIYDNVAFAHSI